MPSRTNIEIMTTLKLLILYCKLTLDTPPLPTLSLTLCYEGVLEDEAPGRALGEVHDLHGVIVDLDRPGHGGLWPGHIASGDVGLGTL